MKKLGFLMIFAFLFTFFLSSNAQAALSTPTVETYDVDTNDIGMTSAVLQGEIIKNGGYNVTDYGFYYGTSRSNLKYKVSLGYAGDQKFRFEKYISGLDEGEKYYYKAYAVNQLGESLGSLCSFTTFEASEPDADTDDATNIQNTTAVLHGSIEKNGGYDVTDYGFYYGTDSDNLYMKVSLGYAGAWKGDFSASITGLNSGTQYYFRAYATNQVGEDTGSRHSFTTISIPVPTVTPTTAPTAIPTSTPTSLSTPVLYTSISGTVNKDTGFINVGWNSVDSSAYYYIAIRKVSTGTSVWTYPSSITSTDFTIGSDVLKDYLEYNTNYYIYVTAHKGSLSSGESNHIYFTTGAKPTVTPSPTPIPTPIVSTYTITGKVNYPNGVAMAGAVVRVDGSDKWMSITDSNGNYRIPNVGSGWHLLTADYGNYKQYSKSINMPSSDVNFDDIYMHGYTIDGYIKYPNSQSPVIGAAVSLDNSSDWTVYTDANGHFTINDALPGGYLLTVSYPGYESYSKWISFDKQDVPLGNIWIHGYSISGFIRDQNNRGIANALVYINDKTRTYTTDSSGYYEFNEVLGSGSYHTIFVEKDGFTPNPACINVTVDKSNVFDQNILLTKMTTTTTDSKTFSYKYYKDSFYIVYSNLVVDGKKYKFISNKNKITINDNSFDADRLQFFVDSKDIIVNDTKLIYKLNVTRMAVSLENAGILTKTGIDDRINQCNINQKNALEAIATDKALSSFFKTTTEYLIAAVNPANSATYVKKLTSKEWKNVLNKAKKQIQNDFYANIIIGIMSFNGANGTFTAKDAEGFLKTFLAYPEETVGIIYLDNAKRSYNSINSILKTSNLSDYDSAYKVLKNLDSADSDLHVGYCLIRDTIYSKYNYDTDLLNYSIDGLLTGAEYVANGIPFVSDVFDFVGNVASAKTILELPSVITAFRNEEQEWLDSVLTSSMNQRDWLELLGVVIKY